MFSFAQLPVVRADPVLSVNEDLDVEAPGPNLKLCGVVTLSEGNLVVELSRQATPGQDVTIPVTAGQFWPLDIVRVDTATTATFLLCWGLAQ